MRPVSPVLIVVLLGCAPVHRIVLQRSSAWVGPIYRLELSSDGDVSFQTLGGERPAAIQRATFDKRRFVELERELERIDFADYDARCDYMEIDGYEATVTWIRGSQKKSVAHPVCPDSPKRLMLFRLESAIDRAAGTERWLAPVALSHRSGASTSIFYSRITERGLAEVLICRDGRVAVTDSRLAFIGRHGVQFQIDVHELARVEAVVAKAEQTSLFGARDEIVYLFGPGPIHRTDRIDELEALIDRWRQSPQVQLIQRRYRGGEKWAETTIRPWPSPRGLPSVITPTELWQLIASEPTVPIDAQRHAVLEGYNVLDVLVGVDAPRDRCMP